MALFLPKRWNRQPATRVQINWRSPFARGLSFAFLPTQGGNELVYGFTGTTSTISVSGGNDGSLAWSPANETGAGIAYGNVGLSCPMMTPMWSFLSVCAPRSQAKDKFLVCGGYSSGGLADVGPIFNHTASDTTFAGAVTLYQYQGGSTYSVDSNGAVITGRMSTYSGSIENGVGGLVYVDRVPVTGGSSFAAGPMTPSVNANLFIGRFATNSTSSLSFDDPISLIVLWDRYLQAEEHQELHENPWQLFAPVRRLAYYIPLTGSGTTRPVVFVAQ